MHSHRFLLKLAWAGLIAAALIFLGMLLFRP